MRSYTFYSPTGEITLVASVDEKTLQGIKKDYPNYIEGEGDPDMEWVQRGSIKRKLSNPSEIKGNVIEGVPENSTIFINGVSYSEITGRVELEFDQPGKYHIRVESWPYLDKEFTIENPSQ